MASISLVLPTGLDGENPSRRRRAHDSRVESKPLARSVAPSEGISEVGNDFLNPVLDALTGTSTPSQQLERDQRAIEPIVGRTDVDLLHAFQHGDERAFAELYARRKQEIYTFCVRMLGGDRDQASDAFQETFIKVYEKKDSFRTGTNVMGWLFMIARNTCLNINRAKRPSESLDSQPSLVSQDRSLGPEYAEEQHFLRELLENAIATLPVDFREPFILREFDGLSYGEIAGITGTTLATTKVRIYRAKQRLRELLRPYLLDDASAEFSMLVDQPNFGPIGEEDRP